MDGNKRIIFGDNEYENWFDIAKNYKEDLSKYNFAVNYGISSYTLSITNGKRREKRKYTFNDVMRILELTGMLYFTLKEKPTMNLNMIYNEFVEDFPDE